MIWYDLIVKFAVEHFILIIAFTDVFGEVENMLVIAYQDSTL